MALLPAYPTTDQAAESAWLKRHGPWLAIAGFLLGVTSDAIRWAVITLDASLLPQRPGDWFGVQGLVAGCGFAALPLVWWLGLKLERRAGPVVRAVSLAGVISVILVVVLELFARSYFHQSGLWQAVRARAGTDYFAREVSLFRLEDAAQHARGIAPPGVVVAGSSQMLHALDAGAVGDALGYPVYRRAVAGMFPMELCAARGFLDFQSDNVLLLMLSGFDLGGRDDVYTDAMRPIATGPGIRDFLSVSPWPVIAPRWRSYLDLWLASGVETWRSRDYARLVIQHPFDAKRAGDIQGEAPVEQQRAAFVQLGRDPDMVALSKASLERFLAQMAPRVRRIVVVEGRVNPAYPDAGFHAMSAAMKDFLSDQARAGIIDYWPVERQDMALSPDDWLDMAHVNENGRAKYTALFTRVLREQSAGPATP